MPFLFIHHLPGFVSSVCFRSSALYIVLFVCLPSGHMTFIQRHINVDATSWCYNVPQRRCNVVITSTLRLRFLNGIYPVGFNPGRVCRVSAQVGCYGRVVLCYGGCPWLLHIYVLFSGQYRLELMGMDTYNRFPLLFCKSENFCDFLSGQSVQQTPSGKMSTSKGKNICQKEHIFPLQSRLFFWKGQNIFTELPPLNMNVY